jgi:hypothetical protein
MHGIAYRMRFKPPYRTLPSSASLLCRAPASFSGAAADNFAVTRRATRSTKELTMKPTVPCLIIAVTLGVAHGAAAQQAIASDAADMQYCRTLARNYQSLHPVQQGVRASDAVMLNGCESDTKATIAALEHRMADQKIDLPQRPAVAQPPDPLKPNGEMRRLSQ